MCPLVSLALSKLSVLMSSQVDMVGNLTVGFSQFNLLGVTGTNVTITALTDWMTQLGMPVGTPPVQGLLLGAGCR